MDVRRKVTMRRVDPGQWPEGTPAEKAPDPDLGTGVIPAERYTSADYMRREWDHMWTKVWLLGGREADLAEPGDYICTEIGDQSILIVRQQDGSIRAFHNVCLHRGNRLREPGVGSAPQGFKCAYHHWHYDLDGRIGHIPDLATFPQGAPPCGGIMAVRCDIWGSFVWFTLDPDAVTLRDFLGVIPSHLDPYHFERMALTRDLTILWDCNWKTSVDAFNESYHVQGIHPQLLWYLDDCNIQIDCYERHNRYLIPFAVLSPRVNVPPEIPPAIKLIMKEAEMDPADYDGPVTAIREELQRFKRRNGAAQGKDYSALNDDQLTDDYHYLIFPNVTLNIHADDLMLFRQRPHPTDPDKMFFDLQTYQLIPEGKPWPERPEHATSRHGEKSIGQVLDQDAYNLPGVQKGMKSKAFPGLWLGSQELRIRHFHHVLEGYLAAGEAEAGQKS